MNFQPKLKEVEMKNMVKNICAAMVISLCAAGHLFATENNPNNEYHKILLEVNHLNSNKKEKCYTYFYNADIDKDFNEKAVFISDGDWKNYMLNINKDSAK